MDVDLSNSSKQRIISILVIVLLVTQSVLLILVLMDLRFIRQLTIATRMISQGDQIESLIGTQAIDFVLPDVGENLISLSEYKGRPILLAFTSHECSACREMYPGLREFLQKKANIEVFVVSMNNTEENRKFQGEFALKGYKNLHVLSATPEVFQSYLIVGTPTFIVIDMEGQIVRTGYASTASQIVELTEGVE